MANPRDARQFRELSVLKLHLQCELSQPSFVHVLDVEIYTWVSARRETGSH